MHQMHQAFHCDRKKSHATHISTSIHTTHSLSILTLVFVVCSCVCWIIEAPRDILYSLIYFQHLKHTPYSIQLKVEQLALHITASLFFLYLSKQTFSPHSSGSRITGEWGMYWGLRKTSKAHHNYYIISLSFSSLSFNLFPLS